MTKILFFDATNSWISVELFLSSEEGKLSRLAKYHEPHNRESSQILVREISRSLQTVGWDKPDIIVTALGPGSFTGVRISVTTARNLSQIWNVPVLGLDSLEIYASHYFSENGAPVSVAIEAKQNKVYFGLRDRRGFWGSVDVSPDSIAEELPEDRLGSYITGTKFTDSPAFFPGQNMKESLPLAEAVLLEKVNEIKTVLSKPDEYSHLQILPNYVRGTYADDKPKVYYT